MADEITYSFQMQLGNGNLTNLYQSGGISVDQTAARMYTDTQEIGTSAEALAKGSISTPGICMFRNLDATNFVEIGYDDSGFKNVIKLKAGETFITRISQSAPYAKADTAAVELFYIIYED